MIPIKKIFIDSKARATSSTSTSNFIIELPETYTLPQVSTKKAVREISITSVNDGPDNEPATRWVTLQL